MRKMSIPTSKENGANVCEACAYFINDVNEIVAEMRHISRDGGREGVIIPTAERVKNERGIEVGEQIRRTVWNFKAVANVLSQRFGMSLADTGLCEAGVARFVHRLAGSLPGDHQCPKWKPRPTLHRIRPVTWRASRDKALEVRSLLAHAPSEVKKTDPCPCGSARTFATCCNKWL